MYIYIYIYVYIYIYIYYTHKYIYIHISGLTRLSANYIIIILLLLIIIIYSFVPSLSSYLAALYCRRPSAASVCFVSNLCKYVCIIVLSYLLDAIVIYYSATLPRSTTGRLRWPSTASAPSSPRSTATAARPSRDRPESSTGSCCSRASSQSATAPRFSRYICIHI